MGLNTSKLDHPKWKGSPFPNTYHQFAYIGSYNENFKFPSSDFESSQKLDLVVRWMVPIEEGHPICSWYSITISNNPNLGLWNMGWLANQEWVLYKTGQVVCNEHNYLIGPFIYNRNITKSG